MFQIFYSILRMYSELTTFYKSHKEVTFTMCVVVSPPPSQKIIK